ncbi:PAS domain-containing protein [Poseidonibacter sp.]|uniref:PAS domain-containing protein n=1 Tax=Poseidonibacter sp. TaxID=2321188 RepID=UPI003C71B873
MHITNNLEQLDTFIEFIPDLAFFKDMKGRYTHCNENFLNFISLKRVDVINKTDFDIFSKENADEFVKMDNDVLASNTDKIFEEVFNHPDNTCSYFHTTKQIVNDKNGNRLGLFCIARNITIRKQYEIIYEDNKSLLEYIAIENNLENILDKIVYLAENRNPNSRCSILLVDKEKNCLIKGSAPSLPKFYNDAVNGIKIGENIGSCGSAAFKKQRVIIDNIDTHRNWKGFLEYTNKANLHACWSEPIISSNNEILGTFAIYSNQAKTPSNYELKLITSYAHLASVAIEKNINFNLLREKENEILEQIQKSNDELKQINTLTQSLTNYQSTLLSLFDKGDAVLFKWKNNENWDVEYVSESITKLLVHEKEDFLSLKVDYKSCIHPDDIEDVFLEVKDSIDKNLDYFKHHPYRIVTKDHQIKWVLDYTVTQKNKKGEITHFIGYITDITEQRKQQDIIHHQSKMVSMGEMIGNIAHQWRQPLSLISSVATASKLEKELDTLKDDVLINNMKLINTNAQYLSNTIDDFRNFIKGDRDLVYFNLSKNINSFLNVVQSTIQTSDIQVIKNLDDEISMLNYPNDMIQAFINILNNSKDALVNIDKKERFFFISTKKIENKIIISLKDNAGGIKDELLKKVFEPYFTTKHKSYGTGLGLNITYNFIVKGMNGNINVQNCEYLYNKKVYKGCEFIVTFAL